MAEEPNHDKEPSMKIAKLDDAHSGRKKPRKRKKAMFKAIVDQMEFYLGDTNCSKSVYMAEKMTVSPWLDLDIFLRFNKLVSMLREYFGHADNTDDLWAALNSTQSDVFEIRDDPKCGRQIKRRKDLEAINGQDHESRTIYVERLPIDITIEMVKQLFEKYGPVAYVSLPKFKHNRMAKGFAFVEFDSEDGVKAAVEAYIAAKRKIPQLIDPSELLSVKTYHIEQEALGEDSKEKDETAKGESKEKQQDEAADDEEGDKKEKRKRKRKRKQKEECNGAPQDPLATVQIMPKTEWKRLRNKYLNLQRKNMAHSKMKLRQFLDKQKEEQLPPEADEEKPKLEFVPGIIVKFIVEEPIEDDKKVKQRIKAAVMENVNYVDAKIGASEYYVRCAHADQAKTLANAKILGQPEILSGEAEVNYWQKIKDDREAKLSGKVKVKKAAGNKPRGKDRLVLKVHEMQQKENCHKFFNEDED